MKQKAIFAELLLIILALGLMFFSVSEIDINPDKKVESSGLVLEKDFVDNYCSGYVEYTLPDKTRVDCLTDEYAIEFDFAKKWAESIGQSLYYAKQTGKKPAVAIILKKQSDKKYVQRIKDIDLGITVFEICSDDYDGADKAVSCLQNRL